MSFYTFLSLSNLFLYTRHFLEHLLEIISLYSSQWHNYYGEIYMYIINIACTWAYGLIDLLTYMYMYVAF